MSRTDKDLPYFVQEMQHAADGGHTEVWHGLYCRDRVDPYTGQPGPKREWRLRRVTRALAAANGWDEDPHYADLNAMATFRYLGRDEDGNDIRVPVPYDKQKITVRQPVQTHDCDLDTATSRCHRYGSSHRTRWHTGDGPSRRERHIEFYGPERAAVRDACRDATRDYNAAGDRYDAGEWEPAVDLPVRQTRRATWAGGWWD